jgi:hypothetical protein
VILKEHRDAVYDPYDLIDDRSAEPMQLVAALGELGCVEGKTAAALDSFCRVSVRTAAFGESAATLGESGGVYD